MSLEWLDGVMLSAANNSQNTTHCGWHKHGYPCYKSTSNKSSLVQVTHIWVLIFVHSWGNVKQPVHVIYQKRVPHITCFQLGESSGLLVSIWMWKSFNSPFLTKQPFCVSSDPCLRRQPGSRCWAGSCTSRHPCCWFCPLKLQHQLVTTILACAVTHWL